MALLSTRLLARNPVQGWSIFTILMGRRLWPFVGAGEIGFVLARGEGNWVRFFQRLAAVGFVLEGRMRKLGSFFFKDNRKSQAKFRCVSCGMSINADQNAALNTRALAASKMATELAGINP